jgi:hypothetical protein
VKSILVALLFLGGLVGVGPFGGAASGNHTIGDCVECIKKGQFCLGCLNPQVPDVRPSIICVGKVQDCSTN